MTAAECETCGARAACLMGRLPAAVRKRLVASAHRVEYLRGSTISLSLGHEKTLPIVCSGSGKVFCGYSEEREIFLRPFSEGDAILEALLADLNGLLVLLRAEKGTRLCLLSLPALRELLREECPPLVGVLADLTRLARGFLVHLSVLHRRSGENRVLGALLMNGRSLRHVRLDGPELEAPLTHQDLADICGLKRNTVTLILHKLRAEGLLRIARGRIVFRPQPLRERLQCPQTWQDAIHH